MIAEWSQQVGHGRRLVLVTVVILLHTFILEGLELAYNYWDTAFHWFEH